MVEGTVPTGLADYRLRVSLINPNSALHGSIRTDKGSCGMRAKQAKLFLVESAANDIGEQQVTFRTGERITRSGVYRVIHRKHRLPHEVTLLRDQVFPRCAKCHDQVKFQLVRGVQLSEGEREFSTHIYLYELPALEDGVEGTVAV
jgi:hypothetical protein